MEPYLFQGVVLPERAQLTHEFALQFSHIGSGTSGQAKVSIVLNQVAVWVESEHDWDILDLRNVVKTLVQDELAKIGYLKGYAYDFDVIRVLDRSLKIDYVFGVEILCLEEKGKAIDLHEVLPQLREKTVGKNGVFLNRCFNDLIFAMKHADDTGFYCYRAIESLRQHCTAVHGLSEADNTKQWEKFRKVSGCDKSTLMTIKGAADPLRHGGITSLSSDEREKLFINTWDVVERYLRGI